MATPSASPSSSASVTPSASPSLESASDQVVTLAEAKDVLHVSGSDHDIRIDALIDAATAWAREYQGRQYITETCIDYLDAFPAVIRPRWSPLIAVTKIEYIDTAGVWQTLASDEYDVDADSEPGRIVPAYNESWPNDRGDINGIKVTYTAGYGTSHDDVPAYIRTGILLLVYDWFYHPDREGKAPASVQSLLGINRVVKV